MHHHLLLVYNPHAAAGKAAKVFKECLRFLNDKNIAFTILETSKHNTSNYIAEILQTNTFTNVWGIGGDGTLQAIANGIKNHLFIPVSIIKAGTGNDFSRMVFPEGFSLQNQLLTALYGSEIQVDAGLCNKQVFINGIGIGFDGKVAEAMGKKRMFSGHAAYKFQVVKNLFFYRIIL
jgi:diacylglycerol kinase family enzyme